MRKLSRVLAAAMPLVVSVACKDKPATTEPPLPTNCLTSAATPTAFRQMTVLGKGPIANRYTAEVTTLGSLAYTTTWGNRTHPQQPSVPGNAINIWDVTGDVPLLIDSVIVTPNVGTLGDVAVSDDSKWLVVPTEYAPGRIVIYDLADPRHPVEKGRFGNADMAPGVHTAEVARVGGKLYAFLSIDPSGTTGSRLVVVDITDPAAPVMVHSEQVGQPFVHDTHVRDGLLFLALWDGGVQIRDIGGGEKGGTVGNPVVIGTVVTKNGRAHNVAWPHDPATGARRFLFVGEEGPASIGSTSTGDVHVLDVCDMANPREVAFFHIEGAGAHNFTIDEANGILYAAFYNAGVQALDVRGDLGSCTAEQKSADGRCNLAQMGRLIGGGVNDLSVPIYIWGVEFRGGMVYASDMLNGIWKLRALSR